VAFSRRLFLRHGFLAAAAACVSSPLLAAGGGRPIGGNEEAGPLRRGPSSNSGSWQNHASALDYLGRDAFAGAVGTNFKVFLTAGSTAPVWVTLLAVDDLPKITPANTGSFAVANKAASFTPSSSGFVLVFGGSSELPQETHLFEHDSLGRFALFTVPQGNGQQLYTAVINRLDGASVIAIPVATGKVAQQNQSVQKQSSQNQALQNQTAGADGSKPAATSATVESHADGLSGSQGARRSSVRD
jgi:Domain of unknown function (DUF6916)